MKRFFSSLTAAAFVVTAVLPALAAETVTGELVEVACYMKMVENGTGEGHAACALKCAGDGAALGILTAFGVYTITGEMVENNNAKLLDYIAKNVEATGEVLDDHGELYIEVTSVEVK